MLSAPATTAIPAIAEPERPTRRLRAVPEAHGLLQLQQSAGNQAVAALVARSRAATLSRQPETGGAAATLVPGGGAATIAASVGRGGENRAADVEVVQGLLARAGAGNPDVASAIERYQRDTMGWRHPDGRVDPGGRTLRRLAGAGGGGATASHDGGAAPSTAAAGPAPAAAGPAPSTAAGPAPAAAGPTPASAPAAPVVPPAAQPAGAMPEGAQETFRTFAEGRAPLMAALSGAPEPDRRAARQALRAYDAQHLPALRALQQQMGGQWNIPDPAARDAVLAAIQLEAACDAEGDLHNNSDEVHRRVARASGMDLDLAWCGMFTVDHFRHSGMDSDLADGFLHVDNVHDYFTYRHDRNARRVPKWIWADHAWHDLREYHALRGAERTWLTGAQVGHGGALDIRAGDVVLIDPQRDGTANHIVKASSYDPATGLLLTIGGNDGGYIIDQGGGAADHTGALGTAEAASGERMRAGGWGHGQAGGHVGSSVVDVHATGAKPSGVFGVGRPSIVDFEQHPYDRSGNIRRPPAPLAG